MSPAKKYTEHNLQVIANARRVVNGSQSEPLSTSSLPSLKVLYRKTNPTSEIFSDWMQFSSTFGQGIFDKL